MRTLYTLDPRKAETVADETLRVWCSFAQKLGIWTVKRTIEDMCFAVLEPERFEEIVRSRDEFFVTRVGNGTVFRGRILKEQLLQNYKSKMKNRK